MRGIHRLSRIAESVTEPARRAVDRLQTERKAGGLVPLEHENFRYRQFLAPTYGDYVARVSWADHAVSLRTAAVLLQFCESRSPRRLLDTGSGYSSYVLRRYAKESGAEVVSVDDDAAWMTKTEGFLAEYDLADTGRLLSWEEFREEKDKFDLIFHDLGTGGTRVASMEWVSYCALPGAAIVFDDIHVPAIRAEARRVSQNLHRRLLSLAGVTHDEINRYAGVALPGAEVSAR